MKNRKIIKFILPLLFIALLFLIDFISERNKDQLLEDFLSDEITEISLRKENQLFPIADAQMYMKLLSIIRNVNEVKGKSAGSRTEIMFRLGIKGKNGLYQVAVHKNKGDEESYIILSRKSTAITYLVLDNENFFDFFYESIR